MAFGLISHGLAARPCPARLHATRPLMAQWTAPVPVAAQSAAPSRARRNNAHVGNGRRTAVDSSGCGRTRHHASLPVLREDALRRTRGEVRSILPSRRRKPQARTRRPASPSPPCCSPATYTNHPWGTSREKEDNLIPSLIFSFSQSIALILKLVFL
ncbi:hypothetical protein CFC21_102499 [Triticum aestivum]|uniref:Uncharacterized protein n=2 Tax=Triticum aestivum TaxID=4565 RepID=A0A3B6SC03_WHEAT|nr:hypothetical protein CFC21_102499 [Triticum aestivum]